ncbi:MAG TPA: IclR family transcriptional regulator [Dehalococcoidales bacterium]|nr:IclR family transcriptional regulator [Dehalococcoidales bacterium]
MENQYKVPAVEQALRVMLCLAENGVSPRSLTEICEAVDIHRSKAFSILNTLNEFGFVKKYPNRGGYTLGPGLLTVTGNLLESLSLPRIAEPVLIELAKTTQATVALGVISEQNTYVVAQYMGAPGMGVSSPIGYVTHITYGAHGKAIAAFLPEAELEALLRTQELYFFGRPEKYQAFKLRDELAQCRRTGYALELGDIQPGMNAIATPVLDQDNYPVGYITIVGFFPEEAALELGPLAVEAAKAIAREAGHRVFWQNNGTRRPSH